MLKRYERFLKEFDKKLQKYFDKQSEDIVCCKGCSACCEVGDYPFSQLEMMYLMKGFKSLKKETQEIIKRNVQQIKSSRFSTHFYYKCPFLIDKKCAVYKNRGIVCRTFGLAYILDKENNTVRIPECSKEGLNFAKKFDGVEVEIDPIEENLELPSVINSKLAKKHKLDFGETRSLIDWI